MTLVSAAPSRVTVLIDREMSTSPQRMDTELPHLALTLAAPRLVSASSMTSSWHSVPTCSISTAAAAWTHRSMAS